MASLYGQKMSDVFNSLNEELFIPERTKGE